MLIVILPQIIHFLYNHHHSSWPGTHFHKISRSAHENLVAVGREVLAAGKPILCDTQMVAAGISRTKLHAKNPIICTLNEPEVKDIAKQIGNTRTAAALSLWIPYIEGAVVAIGNAPTALFRLLEMLDQGMPKPSIILGKTLSYIL